MQQKSFYDYSLCRKYLHTASELAQRDANELTRGENRSLTARNISLLIENMLAMLAVQLSARGKLSLGFVV